MNLLDGSQPTSGNRAAGHIEAVGVEVIEYGGGVDTYPLARTWDIGEHGHLMILTGNDIALAEYNADTWRSVRLLTKPSA